LILITVFEFICIFFIITRSTKVEDTKALIFILLGFFVTNVVLSFQFNRISRLNYEKSKIILIEAQNKIQLAHIEDTINKYEIARKTIHDMRKHLSVIENLIDYEPEVLQDYIKHFNDSIQNLAGEFVCTNRVLSVIMDMKINQAKRSGIDVHMNFDDVPFDLITDIDVTAIFSNLWDNAIESALSIKEGKKYINVTVGYEGPIILIVFENNYNHQISEENGKYITSKGG
jgi:sensor histidine kinase regulating citrate/malate metabolism